MKKKFLWLFIGLCCLICLPMKINAAEKVVVYLFSRETCPHCQDAKAFLEELKKDNEYKDLFEVRNFDVVKYQDYRSLFEKAAEKMGDEADGVPYFVIGDESSSGFGTSSEDFIKEKIKETSEIENFVSPIEEIVGDDGEVLFEDVQPGNIFIPLIIIVIGAAIIGFIIFAARS